MHTPTLDQSEQWLTTREVAARTRMSVGWVTKQRKSGALPHVRVGRNIRFRLADVEAFQRTFKAAESEPAPVIRLRAVA